MRTDLLKVITTMMKLSCEFDEEDVLDAISSLKNNWPGLTDIEKKEMSAIIEAYSIMAIVQDESDYQESTHDSFKKSDYDDGTSNYYDANTEDKNSKRGFFKKR